MTSLFTNFVMLSAMVAVLIPPIIEWLFRRRKRQIELPTIRFLLKKKEQEKVKRQDRILLLIRMLVLFLLVGSLARPLVRRAAIAGTQSRSVYFVLDATASMQQSAGITTAFGLMQKKASGVVRELTKGTRVSVVTISDGVKVVSANETDFLTVSAKIERLRPESGAVSITEGLQWILKTIEEEKPTSAELYVFSDFQTFTWQRPGGEAAKVSESLSKLAELSDLFLVDVGGIPEFNCMVTALSPDEWVMSTGMPVKFRAVIETWGKVRADAKIRINFLVDGIKKSVRDVDTSRDKTTLEFNHQFARPGEYLIEVAIEGDEHRVDNRRLYLSTVPEAVKVLILDESAPIISPIDSGPTSRNPLPHDSSWLAHAVAPATRPGMDKVSRFGATTVHPNRISYENLADYGVVILTDMANLNESVVAKLEKYVKSGGSLWMFMGSRVNPYSYNKFLFRDGDGLLPAKLVSASDTDKPFVKFAASDHQALAVFSDHVTEDARFLKYFQIEPAKASRTLLALSNEAPAVIERSFGRGKVLLMNTSVGTEWSTIQATVEFPMLVQELLRYLVGTPDASVNLNIGDVFEQPVFISSQHLLLRYPNGQKERLTPVKIDPEKDEWMARFGGTRQQGLYEIDSTAEALPRNRFVVNQNSGEGDLTRLSKSEFREAYGSSSWQWLGKEIPIEEFAAKRHSIIELAPWILSGLAVLLGMESFLAMRFGRRRGARA
jgi:hypothetical protein